MTDDKLKVTPAAAQPDSLTTKHKFGTNKSGLHARMSQAAANPASQSDDLAATMTNRIGLMLDTSSSMSEAAEGDRFNRVASKAKIEHMREAVSGFIAGCDFMQTALSLDTFPLHHQVALTRVSMMLTTTVMLLEADGGTPLLETMEFVLRSHPITRGIIVSDGEASNREAVLACARDYREAGIPVDCVHIGRDVGGEELLRTIAEITSGLYIKFDNVANFAKSFKFLTPGLRFQLTSGNAGALGAKEIK
jgi:hypothetical protein